MTKHQIIRIGCVLSVLLGITSCRVGPEHCIPQVDFTESWHSDDQNPILSNANPLALGELFNDEILNNYLREIVYENHDIRLASVKICEAFALRRMSAAKLLPFIDGRIAYNSSKPAGGVLQPGDTAQGGGAVAGIPLNIKQQTFLADFDALWEIDLFGKRQREVESATAFTQMEKAAYHDMIVSLTAEFARNYLELRRTQKDLELVREEIGVLQQIKDTYEKRLGQGLDSRLSLLNHEVTLEQLTAEAPFLEGEILSLIYRLSVLLGKPPATLIEELTPIVEFPRMNNTIPIGFPSDLLRRRPDIRLAERQIAKATADVGVAIADLFPKLTLTGSYGFQNLHLGMTKGKGESWGYGGDLITPFFHGGSLKANVNRYQWMRHEAFIAYEQAVLKALEESESAIARFLKSQESTQGREKAYAHSIQLLTQEQKLYDDGLSNTLQLLERKQKAVQAEREWVNSFANTETQLISLYKALGSGWQ